MGKISIKAQAGNIVVCFKGDRDENAKHGVRVGSTDFSDKSRRAMRRYLLSSRSSYKTIITLTYPSEFVAERFRADFKSFIERLRRYYGGTFTSSFSLFWFLEFQKNGQPHFHAFCTDRIEHGWLRSCWFQIVKSGRSEHYRAGTSIEWLRAGKKGLAKYVAKYASKQEQKEMPDMYKNSGKTGRWWGIVGCRDVVAAHTATAANNRLNQEIIKLANWIQNQNFKIVFDDYGAKVYAPNNQVKYWDVFRRIKLLQTGSLT